jgi:hypothetical protein
LCPISARDDAADVTADAGDELRRRHRLAEFRGIGK